MNKDRANPAIDIIKPKIYSKLKRHNKNESIVGDGRVIFIIKGNDYRLVVSHSKD